MPKPLHLHQASAITAKTKIKGMVHYSVPSDHQSDPHPVEPPRLAVVKIESEHMYIVEMAIFNICYVQRATTPKVG